jgi:hypothetical protein
MLKERVVKSQGSQATVSNHRGNLVRFVLLQLDSDDTFIWHREPLQLDYNTHLLIPKFRFVLLGIELV